MRKPVAVFVALIAVCCLCGVALAAGPRGVPHRYIPRSLDGDLQTIVRTTDGTSFAAWSYRNGAEYDIAVSRTDDSGRWTEPEFFGADDGVDQVEPTLTIDADGNVYLAYTDRAIGAIRVTALRADGSNWGQPIALLDKSPDRVYSSAKLLVVGDHLIVAYVANGRTAMVDLTRQLVLGGGISALTITESGDPVGYSPGDEGSGGSGSIQTIGEDSRPVEVFSPIRKRGTGSGQPF